jgi:3-hexulose-6-phosphate synthase/6-phospho-3-hexuloisomerase
MKAHKSNGTKPTESDISTVGTHLCTVTKLQVALDTTRLGHALRMARDALAGGADIIEAGTPLIKSRGIDSVVALKQAVEGKANIVADMKTADAGYLEVAMAAEAGADVSTILARAPGATIAEARRAADDNGIRLMADLIGIQDPILAARRMEDLGMDFVCAHFGIDQLGSSSPPLSNLTALSEAIEIPLALAGGISKDSIPEALELRPAIVIVGRAITRSDNVMVETASIKEVLGEGR